MGQGVGQRRCDSGLAEAPAPTRFCRLAEEVGSGKDVFLDRSEQEEDEQRLRAASGYERGVHLRSDESPDGEKISPCSVVFGQFQKTNSRKLA